MSREKLKILKMAGSAENVVSAISDNLRQGENYRYKLN